VTQPDPATGQPVTSFEHPFWCDPARCSAGRWGGMHRSAPAVVGDRWASVWRDTDGGHVVVRHDRGWTTADLDQLADAVRALAHQMRRG
jgi:hypothetical protein